LSELSERQLRHHLRHDYLAKARNLSGPAIPAEIALFERNKRMNETILSWILQKSKVVVYPAGKQAAWLLKNTLLSKADVVAISDRNSALHGQPFNGYPVIAPREISELKPDIVLIASDLHQSSILRDLKHLETNGIKLIAL
jgi:FlaA1/EpsC-like NDP-sugar epimerase